MPEVWQAEVSPHLLYRTAWSETGLGSVRETAGGEGASLHPRRVPGPPGPTTASRDTIMLGEVISSPLRRFPF